MKTRQIPTIASIEQDGTWVCAKNTGKPKTVRYWRSLGLLTMGRDWKKVKVRIPRKTGELIQDVPFYRRAKIDALGAVNPNENRRATCKAHWAKQERRKINGVEHLRLGAAAAFLGITRDAIVLMPDFTVTSSAVGGKSPDWYPLAELQAKKRERDALDRRPSRGMVTLERAMELTGRSERCLCDDTWCKANGVKMTKEESYRRKGGKRVRYTFGLTSLRTYAAIPKGKVTAVAAAAAIGCHPRTARSLFERGVIASQKAIANGTQGRRSKWFANANAIRVAKTAWEEAPSPIAAGRRLTAPKVPGGRMSTAAAAKALNLHEQTVIIMCRKAMLDAIGGGARNRPWYPSVVSVTFLRDAIAGCDRTNRYEVGKRLKQALAARVVSTKIVPTNIAGPAFTPGGKGAPTIAAISAELGEEDRAALGRIEDKVDGIAKVIARDNDLCKKLTTRDIAFLDALYDRNAFSAAYAMTSDEIAGRDGSPGSCRAAGAKLKPLGLVDSREGRGNGYWLTNAGQKLVQNLRQ